jgi:hypothetical protein
MLSPAIVAFIQALGVFAAMLAFVTVCLGMTKTLVDAGFLKNCRIRILLSIW